MKSTLLTFANDTHTSRDEKLACLLAYDAISHANDRQAAALSVIASMLKCDILAVVAIDAVLETVEPDGCSYAHRIYRARVLYAADGNILTVCRVFLSAYRRGERLVSQDEFPIHRLPVDLQLMINTLPV